MLGIPVPVIFCCCANLSGQLNKSEGNQQICLVAYLKLWLMKSPTENYHHFSWNSMIESCCGHGFTCSDKSQVVSQLPWWRMVLLRGLPSNNTYIDQLKCGTGLSRQELPNTREQHVDWNSSSRMSCKHAWFTCTCTCNSTKVNWFPW